MLATLLLHSFTGQNVFSLDGINLPSLPSFANLHSLPSLSPSLPSLTRLTPLCYTLRPQNVIFPSSLAPTLKKGQKVCSSLSQLCKVEAGDTTRNGPHMERSSARCPRNARACTVLPRPISSARMPFKPWAGTITTTNVHISIIIEELATTKSTAGKGQGMACDLELCQLHIVR